MNKKAAIYARVSTDDQADHGYSLPSQIDACVSFAEKFGYSVVAEFRDDLSGATPIQERPAGNHLTKMIKQRTVDAVIVHQVDRLSRDIVDLLTTVRNWLQAGIDIYTLDVGKIESELDIVLVIKGWQGSDERKKIRERSMRGKRAKARAGHVVGGRAPYGYKHLRDDNGKILSFEIVDDEAKIIKLVFQWYVNGDKNGKRLSAGKIAKRLSTMGIATPGESRPGYYRKRKSNMWQPAGVLDIISREVYAGTWNYGARIGSSHNFRPQDEWIPVEVPAIIDRNVWKAAQKQRQINKQMSKRNKKHDYLLSGLITCNCGFSRAGEYFSNHRYYTCTWRNNHHSGLENRKCVERSIRADAIEADVWDSILAIFLNIEELEMYLRKAQEDETNSFDPKQEELNAIVSMLQSTESEALEIGQAITHATGIVSKSLEKDMEAINSRYDALINRKEELLSELNGANITDDTIQNIIEFAQDVQMGIKNADFDTKRRLLEILNVKVLVREGRFYVTSLIGDWDGDIRKIRRREKVCIVNASH